MAHISHTDAAASISALACYDFAAEFTSEQIQAIEASLSAPDLGIMRRTALLVLSLGRTELVTDVCVSPAASEHLVAGVSEWRETLSACLELADAALSRLHAVTAANQEHCHA